jgi:hypothetical protein
MNNKLNQKPQLNKHDVSNSILTFDNIHELGFEYNYFEGYSYSHRLGYSISVYDVNTILYRGEKYSIKTFYEFIDLVDSTQSY